MSSKDPWIIYPEIWKNQTAFFTYLRGKLRLTWSRFPAKLKWKQAQLVSPPKDYTGRAKKLGKCHYCGEWFAASHLEVDHVEQAGQCNSWETAYQFLKNLLDCNDNWVLADKNCHKIKSYAEKQSITFEEARIAKKAIKSMKQSVKIQLALLSGYGYNDCSNAAKRKLAWTEIHTKGEKI